MNEDKIVTLTVPSRLVAHINFGYQFDHPVTIWRWYWTRVRQRRHLKGLLVSPAVGIIMAFLVTAPHDGSLLAYLAGILLMGAGVILGIRHLQLALWCRVAMLKIQEDTILSWTDVAERIAEIESADAEDDHHEEIEIHLEPEDPD